MATATTIVEVCDALRAALRRRGFFDGQAEPADRERAIRAAVEETSRSLGLRLNLADRAAGGGHAVLAEGVPGLVTIVPQLRVAPPEPGRDQAAGGVDPDLAVTWELA